MITFNEQGVQGAPAQGDEELEDYEALLPAGFVPKAGIPELNAVEALRDTMIRILKGTIAEYDNAKNWEDHIIVRAQREVLGKFLNLINQMKRGEV